MNSVHHVHVCSIQSRCCAVRITGNIECHFPNTVSDETTLLARCVQMCFVLRLLCMSLLPGKKSTCIQTLDLEEISLLTASVFCCRVFSACSSRLSYRVRICCKIHSCGYWLRVFTYFSRRRRKLTPRTRSSSAIDSTDLPRNVPVFLITNSQTGGECLTPWPVTRRRG